MLQEGVSTLLVIVSPVTVRPYRMLIGLQLRAFGAPVCRGMGFLAALATMGRQVADITARSTKLRAVTCRERRFVVTTCIPVGTLLSDSSERQECVRRLLRIAADDRARPSPDRFSAAGSAARRSRFPTDPFRVRRPVRTSKRRRSPRATLEAEPSSRRATSSRRQAMTQLPSTNGPSRRPPARI